MQKKSTHESFTKEGDKNVRKKFSGFEIGFILGMMSLPIFFTIIVPYIHELWHVLCLEFYGCDYLLEFDYSVLNGLHAQTIFSMATCELNSIQTSIVILAGVGFNILLSIIIFLISWVLVRKWYFLFSIFTVFIAESFSLSTSINFFFEDGDPMIFLSRLNMQHYDFIVYFIGTSIIMVSIFLFYKFIVYIIDRELESEFQILNYGFD